jgi:uncharacterized membrane protein YgdD (TMEM256/DUF423 family)
MTHAWETGSRYHLYHAIALLALAAIMRKGSTPLHWAARCWSVGILLFSGSLYWFALGGPHPLVYLTPVGGLTLLAGWFCVIAAGLKCKTEP